MEIKEAIQVLKDHNKWRRGEDETLQITDPKKLGIAIDTVVNEFENLFISGDVKSLNKDEEDVNFNDWLKKFKKVKNGWQFNKNSVYPILMMKDIYNYEVKGIN